MVKIKLYLNFILLLKRIKIKYNIALYKFFIMNITLILLIICLFGMSAYYAGLKKSLVLRQNKKLNSNPIYHGSILAINSSLSSILFIIIWLVIEKNFYSNLELYRNILYIFSIIIFLVVSI